MFQSSDLSKSLTWHATDRKKDGLMCHPADAASWKLVDKKWPSFGVDPRNLKLALSTDGPKQPGNNIDVYLQPLIDDLKRLWEGVRGVYDANQNQTFTLKGCLLLTINDYPAYGNLSGSIVKGYNACPIYLENTKPTRLVNGGRMSFIGSCRWPGRSHPYRRQKTTFNNHTEHSPAPVPLRGIAEGGKGGSKV
ncbi:hypothetical protein ACLB2K_020955 [Fragaria x ananassa]